MHIDEANRLAARGLPVTDHYNRHGGRRERRSPRVDPVTIMAALRFLAGGLSWTSPRLSWRAAGLGHPEDVTPSTGLVARLFGARDVLLAQGVLSSEPAVRRAALQAGIVIDSVDVAATLIAVRGGAPRTALVGVAAGAALFVGLGVIGLTER